VPALTESAYFVTMYHFNYLNKKRLTERDCKLHATCATYIPYQSVLCLKIFTLFDCLRLYVFPFTPISKSTAFLGRYGRSTKAE